MTALDLIARLGLQPHPEGGHYRETFRDPATDGQGRSRLTVIHFLLQADEVSHWHRVDAVETWFWHAGAPAVLSLSDDGESERTITLGADIAQGEAPHAVVPAYGWQSARSLGDWTLFSCAVAPAFQFEGFELAAPDWRPSGA